MRAYSWYRYLREFGVEPIVITRQWENEFGDERDYVARSASGERVIEREGPGIVVRTPYRPNLSHRLLSRFGSSKYRLVRKAIAAWYEIGQYFLTIGPKKELYRAARDYLREHRVDAIIATGEPFVLFRYATQLAAEFGIPWIADYRDPWSHDRRSSMKRLSPSLELHLERRFTRSASALTTVCEYFRQLIATLHDGKPVHIIRNGYDPDAIASARGVEQGRERLTIALAGTLNAWDPIRSFFAVCDRLIREDGRQLGLKLIGINERSMIDAMLSAEFPDLARCVQFLDRLPNDQAAIELSRSNAFLLFNYYSMVGTKIYDYIALQRKILLCYSDDPEALRLRERFHFLAAGNDDLRPMERLIAETNAGIVVKDAAHLEGLLREMLEEFEHNAAIACRPSGVETFSRRAAAGRLATIVEELSAACARS